MKNMFRAFGLFAISFLASGAPVVAQGVLDTPTYSNGQVVSIDPARRLVVLRNSRGRTQTLVFDDLLQSTGSIKAGDSVIVTVRGGPGSRRVSAISLATATPAPSRQNSTSPRVSVSAQTDARDRFSRQVAAVSQNARSVDSSWAAFVTACDVKHPENTGGGRDWFGLWDGRVQADYSSGNCRDLFNQIVASGEEIKKAMAAAESDVQNILEPGVIRDIRRLNQMNWDGWSLAPPPRRDP